MSRPRLGPRGAGYLKPTLLEVLPTRLVLCRQDSSATEERLKTPEQSLIVMRWWSDSSSEPAAL